MGRSYTRLLPLVFAGSALAPLLTYASSRYTQDQDFPWHWYLLISAGIAFAVVGVAWLLRCGERLIESNGRDQAEFIKRLPERYVRLSIFATAAVSLFLELAVIRWQATVFPFFAFYKNLSLLACFAGLGLGYALARDKQIPLFLTMPLLCWQLILMLGMRYGMTYDHFSSLYVLPFHEQLNMGLGRPVHAYDGLQTYFVLAVIFLLTALAFLPIGQVCGALMERREKLSAYTYNLLGSLAGVVLMCVASALWTPPTLWFLIGLSVLLLFCVRKQPIFLWASVL